MSHWTNIRGVVTIRTDVAIPAAIIGSCLGRTTYRVPRGVPWSKETERSRVSWDACTVPRGSEGSLQYHYHYYDDIGIVTIHGNLRDFGESREDLDSVVYWLECSLHKLEGTKLVCPPTTCSADCMTHSPACHVDSAMLQMSPSSGSTEIWTWIDKWKNSRFKFVGTVEQ